MTIIEVSSLPQHPSAEALPSTLEDEMTWRNRFDPEAWSWTHLPWGEFKTQCLNPPFKTRSLKCLSESIVEIKWRVTSRMKSFLAGSHCMSKTMRYFPRMPFKYTATAFPFSNSYYRIEFACRHLFFISIKTIWKTVGRSMWYFCWTNSYHMCDLPHHWTIGL